MQGRNNKVGPRVTNRDRLKSAPLLRLKDSTRTTKCQSIGQFGTFHEINFCEKVSKCRNKLQGRTIWDFLTSILLPNSKKKLKRDPLVEKTYLKKLHSAEKNLKGDPLVSSVMYVTREAFLVQFPGPTVEI